MKKPNAHLVASGIVGTVLTALASPAYLWNPTLGAILGAPSSFFWRQIEAGDVIMPSYWALSFVGGSFIWAMILYPILRRFLRTRPLPGIDADQDGGRISRLPRRGTAVALVWVVIPGLTLLMTFAFSGLAGPLWRPITVGTFAVLVLRGSRLALLLLSGGFAIAAVVTFVPVLYGYHVMFQNPIEDPLFYFASAITLLSCWKFLPASKWRAP
jgi:hypothetical protein